MRTLLLLIAAALLLAPGAWAETCNADGEFVWTSETTGTWTGSPCTASADDTFVLDSADDRVTIDGAIALSTGSITVNAGVLIGGCGSSISTSGAGTPITVNGGKFHAEGCVMAVGRVAANPTYGSGTVTIKADYDVRANHLATDYIVFGDDDPGNPEAAANKVQRVGLGPPERGEGRPSFQKWNWYNVTALDADAETYTLDMDELTGELSGSYTNDGGTACGGSTCEPYVGTRDNLLTTAATPVSISKMAARLASVVRLDGALLTASMDGLDQWVQFEDADPKTACAGKSAKILGTYQLGDNSAAAALWPHANDWVTLTGHTYLSGDGPVQITTDGVLPTGVSAATDYWIKRENPNRITLWTDAALSSQLLWTATGSGTHTLDATPHADDKVIVAGDVSDCTEDVIVTRGIRRGDPFKLVRPFTIDFNQQATRTLNWIDGTLQLKYARIVQPGFVSRVSVSPGIFYACSGLCIYADDASSVHTGYIEDVDFAFPTFDTDLPGDAMTLLFTGSGFGTGFRFNDTGLDMSGVTFNRISIHDAAVEDTSGSGSHGFGGFAFTNLTASRIRVERLNDDAFYMSLECNTEDEGAAPSGISIRQVVSLATVPEEDNSSEAFTAQGQGFGNETDSCYARLAGQFTASDLFLVGGGDGVLSVQLIGQSFDRVVAAGDAGYTNNSVKDQAFLLGLQEFGSFDIFNVGCKSDGVPSTCCSASATGTCEIDFPANNYPNILTNSLILATNLRPSTEVSGFRIGGHLIDSIVYVPNESFQSTSKDFNIFGASRVQRTFVSMRNTGITRSALRTLTDSEANASVEWDRVSDLLLEDAVFLNNTSDNLYEGYTGSASDNLSSVTIRRVHATGFDFPGDGFLDSTGVSAANFTVDGYFEVADGLDAGTDLGTPNGASLTNVCKETSVAATTVFGASSVNDTTISSATLQVGASSVASGIPRFVKDENESGVCSQAKAEALGLAQLGVAHTLLGDFFLEQANDTFSSRDIVKVSGGGGGGGGLPSAW